MTGYTETLDQKTYRCSHCGKTFEVPYYVHDWGYWYAGKICCSYRCMRAAGAGARKNGTFDEFYAPDTPRRINRRQTQEEVLRIEEYLRGNHSIRSTAIKFGRSEGFVFRIKKGMAVNG